jgi:hypothetical protein
MAISFFFHSRLTMMALQRLLLLLLSLVVLLLLLAVTVSNAFEVSVVGPRRHKRITTCYPSAWKTTSSALASTITTSVIYADDMDFQFDVGQGGVRLAQESAVKVSGTVQHKPGSAKPKVTDLIRYTQVREVPDFDAASSSSSSSTKFGATVVCTGRGKELYQDPGSTAESVIVLAPADAARDSLAGAGSAMEAKKVVINFMGGDGLQVLEVLDAIRQLVLMLDVNTKSKIYFNSLSHSTCPAGTSTVTVMAFNSNDDDDDDSEEGEEDGEVKTKKKTLFGIDKALAAGEVYFCGGKWYTVTDEDINPALE